jgi:hypothetical protein
MKFRILPSQLYNKDPSFIYAVSLRIHLSKTPQDVIAHVYSHHGRQPVFQAQYADLELSSIAWITVLISTAKLIWATFFFGFTN